MPGGGGSFFVWWFVLWWLGGQLIFGLPFFLFFPLQVGRGVPLQNLRPARPEQARKQRRSLSHSHQPAACPVHRFIPPCPQTPPFRVVIIGTIAGRASVCCFPPQVWPAVGSSCRPPPPKSKPIPSRGLPLNTYPPVLLGGRGVGAI